MFPKTLSTRISLLAGALAIVGVASLSFVLIQSHRREVIEEVVHAGDSVAETIRLSLVLEMLENNPDGVREEVRSMRVHPGIEWIRIFNKEGEIRYSSRSEEVGRIVDKKAEACYQCHDAASPIGHLPPGDRSRIYTGLDGEKILATIKVIPNEKGCHETGCHSDPSVQSVLGVIDVAVSLEPVEARLTAARRNALLVSAGAVILISGALFVVIRHFVRRPVNRLIRATRRVAAGDYKLHVHPTATDEIGFLARSFNEMIESLDTSHSRLEALIDRLNEMVARKAEELRSAQSQIVQAEKLSSVGLIAAGIAHELNSPLMAIITFAHMVQKTCAPDSQEHKDLDMILREADRCAHIIRNLLEFSRDQKEGLDRQPCDVAHIVNQSLELVQAEFRGRGIETRLEVPVEIPSIEGDAGQLTQVFVNLMLNAAQAMPEGGEFTVSAARASRDDYPRLKAPLDGGGGLVSIRFRDTGHGIRTEDIGKVFDPFFTTKEAGKGYGLGLSVSHGIITRHGGTILVESDGRSGTEFTVLLPTSTPGPTS